MTRSVRSAWSFISITAFSATSMVVGLVITPILLKYLGPARLGAVRATSDWVAYLTLFELGLSGALLPLLSRALANNDKEAVKGTLSASTRAYAYVTLPMLFGAAALSLSITSLVKVDASLHRELRVACLLGSLPLLAMPISPLRALAEANQRGYVLNVFLILQSAVVAVSALIFAKWKFGMPGQMLATVLGALVFAVLVIFDARKNARSLLPSQPFKASAEAARALWKLNTATLIISICSRVGLLTDNIVIGSILNAPTVVPFLMTQRLVQIALTQLQSIGSASWAGLAQLHARGEHDVFRLRFLELNQLVMMAGLAVMMPIVAYNHVFVALWVGEASYAGAVLTLIAACNALILSIASLWAWLYGGTGQMSQLVPAAIASATLNLIVSIGVTLVLSKAGSSRALWGPVLGTTAALVFVNLPMTARLLRQDFEIPLAALAWKLGLPLLLAVPFGSVLYLTALRYPPHGWLGVCSSMSASGGAFVVVCWLAVLSAEDRNRWLHRLRLTTGRLGRFD